MCSTLPLSRVNPSPMSVRVLPLGTWRFQLVYDQSGWFSGLGTLRGWIIAFLFIAAEIMTVIQTVLEVVLHYGMNGGGSGVDGWSTRRGLERNAHTM